MWTAHATSGWGKTTLPFLCSRRVCAPRHQNCPQGLRYDDRFIVLIFLLGFSLLQDIEKTASTAGCVLANLHEPIRDVLLAPSSEHCDNRTFVTRKKTWEAVCAITDSLQHHADEAMEVPAVEGVAVNFGKWETSNAWDSEAIYAFECHAHLHMLLSRPTVDRLAKLGAKGLVGRINHPSDHTEKDCRDLEAFRLLAAETKAIKTQLDQVSNDVGDMKTNIATILSILQNQKNT